MTDVDGVSSRWHSNFSRNRSIFPSRLVFSSRFVLPCFLLLLLKRERVGSRAGANSCKNTNKIWWDGGWSRAEAGLLYGDDKEGTNDGRAPFREETYDIGFYARNNARAPAVRAVLQETPTVFLSSLRRSLFFSISRWRNKVGEEEGREKSGERKGSWRARWARFIALALFFYFLFSTLDERIWHEGEGDTLRDVWIISLALCPRWILVQSR